MIVRNRCLVSRLHADVFGCLGGKFGDVIGVDRVLVTVGQQLLESERKQCSGVEAGEPGKVGYYALISGCMTRVAEDDIVKQHDQYVWRARRRAQPRDRRILAVRVLGVIALSRLVGGLTVLAVTSSVP